jgi:hypothetical protein
LRWRTKITSVVRVVFFELFGLDAKLWFQGLLHSGQVQECDPLLALHSWPSKVGSVRMCDN